MRTPLPRRRLLSLASAILGTAAWAPLRAQRPRVRVGYGGSIDPKVYPGARRGVDAFRSEMTRLGWHEGVNISYLFRFVDDSDDRCRAIAKEFVDARVDLIVTTYNQMAGCALAATAKVPIAAYMADAIELGYIQSLARPGRNLTGVVEVADALTPKRLQLLCQAVPRARRIAFLTSADGPIRAAQGAAATLGVGLSPVLLDRAEELDRAIAGGRDADAWLVDESANYGNTPQRMLELIAASGRAAMYTAVGYARAGGLMSYGYDRIEGARDLARFADRILRGAKPADLPAEQPTRYAFVFNAKTARTQGFQLPRSVLLQVTEVID